MSDRPEERREEDEGEFRLPAARTVAGGLLCLWALVFMGWFTSERANVPLPMLFLERDVTHLPAGTNFHDLYHHGWEHSLLRTYGTLFSWGSWRDAEIGWENVDLFGHAEALAAIVLYTVLGVMGLGALGVRWPWPTRLAVGYGLGVGMAGWVFEQWAIPRWLNRWTVLISLVVMLGVLVWRWWSAARRMDRIDPVSLKSAHHIRRRPSTLDSGVLPGCSWPSWSH